MDVNAAFAIPAIVAHQGGWDEALLIATPIIIIVGLLRIAKRRVDAAHAAGTVGHRVDPTDDHRDDHHADAGPR
jgi:hypothetical protein